MAGDDTVHLRGPMRIGVVAQDARPRAPADRLGLDRIKPYEDFGNVLPVARHENLFPFLQEELYACPGIGNQAGSGTRSLEDARRGEKPFSAMLARLMLSTALGVALKAL